MNTPEVVAAIAAPTTLALAGLIVTAAAREWLHISVAVTVKPIPAVKRQPKNAVAVQVIPPPSNRCLMSRRSGQREG